MVEPEGNRRVVALSPIEEGISPYGQADEVVWAADGHQVDVLGYEWFVDSDQLILSRWS